MASAPLIPAEKPLYRRSVDSAIDEITPCSPNPHEAPCLERSQSHEGNSSKASTHSDKAVPSAVVPARKLQYYFTVFLLTLVCSMLAAFAWTMTCILVHRPATTDQYGRTLFSRWLQATRIIPAIDTVSTLPLALAVCSNVAVVFTQRRCNDQKFSLRQTIVLADKEWMDIEVYMKLMRGHWERYGCTFLYIAILLTVMGAIIPPLQSVFLETIAVHAPGYLGEATRLTDIPDRFGDNIRWGFTQLRENDQDGVAQLRSSIKRIEISFDENPTHCQAEISSFHSSYAADFIREGRGQELRFQSYKYFLATCMPGNQRRSSWKSTHRRQDFSEALYLNITTYESEYQWYRGYFKITVDTTAGYFELPNYMNGQLPRPLLVDGPEKHCGRDYIRQGPSEGGNGDWGNYTLRSDDNTRRQTYPTYEDNNATADMDSFGFFRIANKGPLLMIALALFGPGSYIAERNSRPESSIDKTISISQSESTCVERMPFVSLLNILKDDSDSGDLWRDPTTYADDYQLCSTNHHRDLEGLTAEVRTYVQYFTNLNDIGSKVAYEARLQNALEAAVFLANQAWLTSSFVSTLTVHYDLGTTMQAPYISPVGIILLSALLGIYIVSLLSMATYSIWDPRWTGRLDSFAVLRLGAAVAAHFPLQANNMDKMEVLDETPGWVGDIKGLRRAGTRRW